MAISKISAEAMRACEGSERRFRLNDNYTGSSNCRWPIRDAYPGTSRPRTMVRTTMKIP